MTATTGGNVSAVAIEEIQRLRNRERSKKSKTNLAGAALRAAFRQVLKEQLENISNIISAAAYRDSWECLIWRMYPQAVTKQERELQEALHPFFVSAKRWHDARLGIELQNFLVEAFDGQVFCDEYHDARQYVKLKWHRDAAVKQGRTRK